MTKPNLKRLLQNYEQVLCDRVFHYEFSNKQMKGQSNMNSPLDGKYVAFVGKFDGGSRALKDLVYEAGGAPTDTIPAFTNYLVVGLKGKDTQAYRKCDVMLESGHLIELTPDQLRDVCSGMVPAPEPKPKRKSTTITFASKEAIKNEEETSAFVFQAKRESFIQRYGVLQPDGNRAKMNVKAMRVLGRVDIK